MIDPATASKRTTKGAYGTPLPGGQMAYAWLNASVAQGQEPIDPMTYRTILVERFKNGIQVVSSDRRLVLGQFCPFLGDDLTSPPGPEELPIESIVVVDFEGRAVQLMKHVAKLHTRALKEGTEWPEVNFRIGTASIQPTLGSGELDQRVFIIDIGSERLILGEYESDFLDWRQPLLRHDPEPAGWVPFGVSVLQSLGQLRGVGYLKFRFSSNDGLVLIEPHLSEAYLFGAVAPVVDPE